MPFRLTTPIGLLFTVYGVLLSVRGMLPSASSGARDLGLNVNLIWGSVLLLFGLAVLISALFQGGRRSR